MRRPPCQAVSATLVLLFTLLSGLSIPPQAQGQTTPPGQAPPVLIAQNAPTDWVGESLYYKLKKKFYLRDGRITRREQRELLKIRRKELMKHRQQQLNRRRFGLG